MPTIDFYRLRFHFQALARLQFPPAGSANIVRGACGAFLRNTAPADVYSRLFEPGRDLGPAPSGLGDWPRPFVLRATHLNGAATAAGDFFFFDLHLFELHQPVLPYFERAFAEWASAGIGPARTPARLDRVESLNVEEQPGGDAPCSLSLAPEPSPVDQLTVRFATPTELKTAGQLIDRPEFAVLFARIRDRIGTLSALYGTGPIEIDFRGMGERAAAVKLTRCNLIWQNAARTSRRTGQTHPLGGFTGDAEYQGVLQEFLPWVRAARFTGVGRQTVWGKGEVHILSKLTTAVRNPLKQA